jgi:hypothetical protein
MKLKLERKKDASRDHLVPLSKQARDVIAVLRKITGDGPLVFRPVPRFSSRATIGLKPAANISGTSSNVTKSTTELNVEH